MQAQPSGRLSDSDVYAITHSESATESGTPAKADSSAYTQENQGELPALLQLQALADADAITPQSKISQGATGAAAGSLHARQPPRAVKSSPQVMAKAAVSSPQGQSRSGLLQLRALAGVADSPQVEQSFRTVVSTHRASTSTTGSSPQGQQPPGLSQLRALAGVADSPQLPKQSRKTAADLIDVASVPLSQWQFGNNGTSHAVWQAGDTPAKQAVSDLRRSNDQSASPQPTRAESAAIRAASPAAWGPSEPPKPVTLQIKVLGEFPSPDRALGNPMGGSLPSSITDRDATAVTGIRPGGFGFEAGYGTKRHGITDGGQSGGTEAAASAAATVQELQNGNQADTKTSIYQVAGIFAGRSGAMQTADPGVSARQHSMSGAGALYTVEPGSRSMTTAMYAEHSTAGLQNRGVSHQGQPWDASGVHRLQGVGSAGADELAEAASGMSGSPWDPKQGPKLLESLSDFSSFTSSLSMLQQLAGKSAAGLANLGIGSSASPKSQENKKSDKGHLISAAPTSWWRRRPGSAKKSHAPQGSGKLPRASAQGTGKAPDSPLANGISQFSAPVEGSNQHTVPASTRIQPAGLTKPETSGGVLVPQSTTTAQSPAGAGRGKSAGTGAHNAQGSLMAGGFKASSENNSEAAPGDATSSIYYNFGTADRPLSSFPQAPGPGVPSSVSGGPPQGGQATSHTAGTEIHSVLDASAADVVILQHSTSAAEVSAIQAMSNATAARGSGMNANPTLAAALSQSASRPYPEGYSAGPSPQSSPMPSPGSIGATTGNNGSHVSTHVTQGNSAGGQFLVSDLGLATNGPSSQLAQDGAGHPVQQHVNIPVHNVGTAYSQLPGAAQDKGHVAAGPGGCVSQSAALNQLYALAHDSGTDPRPGSAAAEGAAGSGSPATVAQSLDLSKVSHGYEPHVSMHSICTLSYALQAIATWQAYILSTLNNNTMYAIAVCMPTWPLVLYSQKHPFESFGPALHAGSTPIMSKEVSKAQYEPCQADV